MTNRSFHSNRLDSGENGIPRDGYPAHAAWIGRDPDSETSIYRKFGQLSARNLLFLQSRLTTLEAELEQYDEEIRQRGDMESKQSQIRWETFEQNSKVSKRPERRLMDLQLDICEKLREYRMTPQTILLSIPRTKL